MSSVAMAEIRRVPTMLRAWPPRHRSGALAIVAAALIVCSCVALVGRSPRGGPAVGVELAENPPLPQVPLLFPMNGP